MGKQEGVVILRKIINDVVGMVLFKFRTQGGAMVGSRVKVIEEITAGDMN